MAPKAPIPVFLAAVAALFIIMALSRVPEPAAALSGGKITAPETGLSDKKTAAPATGLSGKKTIAPRKPTAKKLVVSKFLAPTAKIQTGRTSPAPKLLPDRRRQTPARRVSKPAPADIRRVLVMKTAGANDAWWEAPPLPVAPDRVSGVPLPSVKTRHPGKIGGSAAAAGTAEAGTGDVPESSTLILLGIGLVALAWFGRRWTESSS